MQPTYQAAPIICGLFLYLYSYFAKISPSQRS